MQEHRGRPKPKDETSEVADRLDGLSAPRADRVLRRAIELQSDSDYDDPHFDLATIARVADELGVHRDLVARALTEELNKPEEFIPTSLSERVYGPRQVSEQALVAGDRLAVDRAIRNWMVKHEGMQVTRSHAEGTEWVKRQSPVNSIRQGLKLAGGTGALRNVGATHKVETVTDDQHVVSLRTDTKMAHIGATAATVGGVIAGIATLIPLGLAVGWTVGITAGIGIIGTVAGVSVAVARTWIGQIRRGLQRAVTGIAHPEVANQDSVGQAVFDILDSFRGRR